MVLVLVFPYVVVHYQVYVLLVDIMFETIDEFPDIVQVIVFYIKQTKYVIIIEMII